MMKTSPDYFLFIFSPFGHNTYLVKNYGLLSPDRKKVFLRVLTAYNVPFYFKGANLFINIYTPRAPEQLDVIESAYNLTPV
jgi:hypothetical protein